ncbi:uncharacterized protein LOC100678716 [Nasonia vitripennis]|uniref:Uncharacterized protein n=1 Tax=Nasonia vitripennis TaxID=7425 RepID=A0A7M7IQB3_NASVI|nr:uncharacterized protein LOC100678716 [Nasonia vitripennis]
MEATFAKIVILCIVGVAITEVTCGSIEVKNLEIQNVPNDYFGEIETEVKPVDDNSLISVKVPILKGIGEGYQLKVNLKFNNIPILKDQVFPLCDAIAKDGFFKPLIEKIEPAGKFPSACPIPAGEWSVSDFKINMKDFLPFGVSPSGDFDVELDVGEPNAEPLVKVLVSGTIKALTGLPSLGSLF